MHAHRRLDLLQSIMLMNVQNVTPLELSIESHAEWREDVRRVGEDGGIVQTSCLKWIGLTPDPFAGEKR